MYLLRPHSIAELATAAEASVHFSTSYSLRSWLRSTDLLIKEAASYQHGRSGSTVPEDVEAHEREFMSWVKVAKILLDLAPSHPQYRSLTHEEKAAIRSKGSVALTTLANMKSTVNDRYETWRAKHPDWSDEAEVAKEKARRRRAEEATMVSYPPESSHRSSSSVSYGQPYQQQHHQPRATHQDLHRHLIATPYSPSSSSHSSQHPAPQSHPQRASHQIKYPSLPERSSYSSQRPISLPPSQQHSHSVYPSPASSYSSHGPTPPPPPPPPAGPSYYSHFQTSNLLAPPATSISSSPSRHSRSSSPAAEPTGPPPLRTLNLPPSLVMQFLAAARKNTKKKIETCGLLLGTLDSGTFTVRTLLIPVQKGTGDTCTTLEEEKVFEFQDKRDLLTLGWIHTHPTQTCFMSSLDLHTHSGYQCMLAEAIAVVCAPQATPDLGIFRLTDPPGLQLIMSCNQTATFHPHPEPKGGIYTGSFGDRDRGFGHVRMREGQGIEVVDLREESRGVLSWGRDK